MAAIWITLVISAAVTITYAALVMSDLPDDKDRRGKHQ